MAVPKIDRESGLFEKNVCDKINKKVQILTDNTLALKVPSLAPFYKVRGIPIHLEVDHLLATDTRSGSRGDTEWEAEDEYYADIELKSNNSFSIGNDDAKVNILNFVLKFSNIYYRYRTRTRSSGGSWSDWSSWNRTDYKTFSSFNNSQKMLIGKVDKSPLCDVWFATENGGCIVNIPQGTNDLYIHPKGAPEETSVYCWYV